MLASPLGTFISLACLLILLQDGCVESLSVANKRTSDDDDSENDDDYGTDKDDPDQLVPEQSTQIVVIDEKQATVSEDDKTTKLSHSYLPTIRYIEENHKPIVFIRESEERDDPDQLVPEQSTETVDIDEKQETVSGDKTIKRSHSYLPTIRYIEENHKPVVFIRESEERNDDDDNFNDKERENHESESSDDGNFNDQDSENYKSKSSNDDDHYDEDNQNDESESQSDYDEQMKEDNNNDDYSSREYGKSSSEDESDYESNDYPDRNRKKSKGRFNGSKKKNMRPMKQHGKADRFKNMRPMKQHGKSDKFKNMRPMKQHGKSDKFKEDFREPAVGIKIKVTAERNSRKSRFTHTNKVKVLGTDELFVNKKKRHENSKVHGGILKLHKLKNNVTGMTKAASNSKERSPVKKLNNTKEIYDHSVGSNESNFSNDAAEKINPKLFDKFKKSFRNHRGNDPPLAKENIVFNNIYDNLKNFRKSNREVKSPNHQFRRSHQQFQKDKGIMDHHSNFKKLKKLLDKERNLRSQLNGLKKIRHKRADGEDDKTGELLDQLEDMLIKANIAQKVNSELKSTVVPVEVFDFTPVPDSDSLMSEEDLTKLFVEHIIPFLAKNSKIDSFTHEPIKKM
ncbi:hypothetical protein HNY73_015865 [Argiope bruennichi]|uniref:Uncharacterized protein n=1 Tax=Argiope bruennichi TaxID=94029 RepID=A0A8T0EKZ9_ARGBR|nr:hypothetical protein HNY73_015865 [Argiope bruennichi]